MYIKYAVGGYSDSYEVRDVHYFTICDATSVMEDGSEVDGVSICDGMIDCIARFGDLAIQSNASYSVGKDEVWGRGCKRRKDVIWLDENCSDNNFLAWFRSRAAAQKVLDEICKALDAGKQFFDLTLYRDDGNLRN